jgi:hypothetical protein
MRNLFIIATLLAGAFMAGWFKVQRDGERTTIEINRTEIRQDTREALDRGREFLRQQDLQSRGGAPSADGSFPFLNPQQPSGAAQAGYWSGSPSQPTAQGYGPHQNIDPQSTPSSAWPQVAPAANWQ